MPEGEGRPHDSEIPYMVRSHEQRLRSLENYNLGVLDSNIRDLKAALTELKLEVDRDVGGLRRAFYAFAFSVVGSAIVFAFSIFALLGR